MQRAKSKQFVCLQSALQRCQADMRTFEPKRLKKSHADAYAKES
jgi:hypothetical protein